MKILVQISYVLFLLILSHNALSETLRISPEQLKQQLSDQQLIILDARNKEAYQAGHIQNALNYPVHLTYNNKKINGKISQPIETQKMFRTLGLTKNSRVVVYDNGQLVDAARLFWVLEVYGLTQVKVLDHGYDTWVDKKYPVSLEIPEIRSSNYIATINHKRLASKFTTQLATKNSNQLIIDARKVSDYIGKTSSAKRFGHIPTSINIPASHNISYEDKFASLKPVDMLTRVYDDIPKNKKIVIYCAIGRVSSSNYLALRELGYDVANYDASWNEWGNDFSLPIEK